MSVKHKSSAHNTGLNYEKTAESSISQGAGRLSELPARFLLDHLNRIQFSGSVLLAVREKRKKLWFSQGEIFRIQTNLVPELFGHLMIEKGWINEADLKTILQLQKDFIKKANSTKRLGDWVKELYGVSEEEIQELHELQTVNTILNAMTWDEGTFEITPIEVHSETAISISFRDISSSIQSLFDSQLPPGVLFKRLRPWTPKSQAVDLGSTPLWLILAGCQRTSAHGILTIRKQNKLFEIVIKNGVPLLLYEGTFGQPRQTLIVRKTSEEHEKFFVDQIFRLFSILTGAVHFRHLGEPSQERDSFLQILPENRSEDSREEKGTGVTRSIQPDEDIPLDLKSQFLVRQTNLLKKTFSRIISLVKV